MRRFSLMMMMVMMSVLALGCGVDSLSGGGDAGPPVPDLAPAADLALPPDLYFSPVQACAETTAAICKRLNDCAPALVKLAYGDVTACAARLGIHCTNRFDLPGTSASPLRAHLCAAALAGSSCDDLTAGKLPGDCTPLPGTLIAGTACADDAQCASAACVKPVGSGCGVCGVAPKAGESCAKLSCTTGLACGSANAICAPYARLNEACDANHPCLPTLACKGANKVGTCITPLAIGAQCDPAAVEYAGCNLARSEYCAPGARTCQALPFAGPGGQCGLANGSFTVCSASGHCDAIAVFLPGRCIGAAPDGAACDGAKGPDCTPPAVCSGGICKLTDPMSCR